ncbi:MAG: hypothetical protein Q9164_002796 [Protoblastenia rupestris]
MTKVLVVGVLALQGAFIEHLTLLREAAAGVKLRGGTAWQFSEIRTPLELTACHALVIPGGESTTVSLVAARCGLLEPLRDFVKAKRKPTWGTCAGLILLAESANKTKKGGQELIGGLDVRVNRNYFGRQTESFQAPLDLPFLKNQSSQSVDTEREVERPFNGIFIRAPVVEKVLPLVEGEQKDESLLDETVVAPSRKVEKIKALKGILQPVEVMATLPGRSRTLREKVENLGLEDEVGDIVAVRQGNVFGTSFHPELTGDPRIHVWWLKQVKNTIEQESPD